MESKPISPKPENISPNIPVSTELTDVEKKTHKVSEKIQKEVPETTTEKEEFTELSKDQVAQKIKSETLESIDSLKDVSDEQKFKEIVKGLSQELMNDIDIIKKLHQVYFFNSNNKILMKLDKSELYNLLSVNKSKIENPEVIKYLCLVSPNPFKFYELYTKKEVGEIAKDHELVLDFLKKVSSAQNPERILYNTPDISAIIDELQKDKEFRMKAILCCPYILENLNLRFEGELKDNEELIEILKKSDHPFYIIENFVLGDLKEKIMSDKNLLVTMNKNSIVDQYELRSFESLCGQIKKAIFDAQNVEDIKLLVSGVKSNLQLFLMIPNYGNLFVDGRVPYPLADFQSSFLEIIENLKSKAHPLGFNPQWLEEYPLYKICLIDHRYLNDFRIRAYFDGNPKEKEELLKNKIGCLLYLYDDKEKILSEAKKLNSDQLKELYHELVSVLSPEEKEKNPLFYESLEKSLKILMDEKQVQKTMGVSKKVHFKFE